MQVTIAASAAGRPIPIPQPNAILSDWLSPLLLGSSVVCGCASAFIVGVDSVSMLVVDVADLVVEVYPYSAVVEDGSLSIEEDDFAPVSPGSTLP
jgi:hypothetical protein